MRQPETVEIDGHRFEIAILPFGRGKRLFVRLAKALGPALALALDAAPSIEAAQSSGALGEVVGRALVDLSSEDLDAIFTEMEDTVTCRAPRSDKAPFLTAANQEVLFAGSILFALKVAGAFVRVQFADFAGLLAPPHAGTAPARGTPASSPG